MSQNKKDGLKMKLRKITTEEVDKGQKLKFRFRQGDNIYCGGAIFYADETILEVTTKLRELAEMIDK